MTAQIIKILDNNNITINDVANDSKVAVSTLRNSIKKPIDSWSIRVLSAFAISLKIRPGDLLNMLEPQPYILDINDQKQSIQGVYIPDKETYQQIRGVVEASHLEGWQPTKKDIQYLLDEALNPDPELEKRYEEIFGDQND